MRCAFSCTLSSLLFDDDDDDDESVKSNASKYDVAPCLLFCVSSNCTGSGFLSGVF